MREVVTSGTGRRAAQRPLPDSRQDRHGRAGRCSFARLVHRLRAIRSPTSSASQRKIAFSVLVENGVYGGTAAAPAAADIVNAAVKLGLIHK